MVRRVYLCQLIILLRLQLEEQSRVNLKQSCLRAHKQDSGKNTGTVTVLHNHFSIAIDLFVLSCGHFGRNKSENEGFISFRALAFCLQNKYLSAESEEDQLVNLPFSFSFLARVQRLLSRGVSPPANLSLSRSHPLPDIHSCNVWHADPLHLQR